MMILQEERKNECKNKFAAEIGGTFTDIILFQEENGKLN